MIRSWRNAATRRAWDGQVPNQFRGLDFEAAVELLSALNVAKTLQDLSPLKSIGLHKLRGERRSQWAMTVNARWRICFTFRRGDAFERSAGATPLKSRAATIIEDKKCVLPSTPDACYGAS